MLTYVNLLRFYIYRENVTEIGKNYLMSFKNVILTKKIYITSDILALLLAQSENVTNCKMGSWSSRL